VLVNIDEEGKSRISRLISSQKDMLIQGTGKDNYDAIILVKKFHPDIVLLDATLGISDGVEISNTLKRFSPSTEIVIFSSHVEDCLIQGIVKGKITNCLLIESDMGRLAVILRGIYNGDCYVNPQITARAFQILGEFFQGKVPEPSTEASNQDQNQATVHGSPPGYEFLNEKDYCFPINLSRTELRILRFIAEGYPSKKIAETLSLKDGTVRNYISKVMQKTGLKTRTQIVLYAQQNGLAKRGVRIHH
jgi:DNA-binding NarL/FixJ family response regulator